MTDERNPLEMAIDLFVFAPFGVFITVTEELPKLVEKGRSRVLSQVGMARMMGEMAAPHIQGEAEKALKGLLDRLAPPGPPPAARAGGNAGPTGAAGSAGAPPRPTSSASAGTEWVTPAPPEPGGRSRGAPAARKDAIRPTTAPTSGPAALAIPGYDTLSAMQVVQRLAGLSPSELAAVRAYEEGHRGRKTIINRADQLRAEAG